MALESKIYLAKVMHKRLFPKVNHFTYKVYYVVLPLPAADLPSRFLSFHNKDLGALDGSDLSLWARAILTDYALDDLVDNIILVTMPRVFGYVFNPVSFFLCLDKEQRLRAVISEVHNTFSEQHSYIVARADREVISADQWLEAEKLFHVSPFLPRVGHYKFRFSLNENQLGICIDYYDAERQKQLLTSLTGVFIPMNEKNLNHVFLTHPFVTMKVIFLIHWQALKLIFKGIKIISKPRQMLEKISASSNLTKL
jgi:hypothetical protein